MERCQSSKTSINIQRIEHICYLEQQAGELFQRYIYKNQLLGLLLQLELRNTQNLSLNTEISYFCLIMYDNCAPLSISNHIFPNGCRILDFFPLLPSLTKSLISYKVLFLVPPILLIPFCLSGSTSSSFSQCSSI